MEPGSASDSQSALDAAKALFRREALPFPPLPERLAGRLYPAGTSLFATRELPRGAYAMGHLVSEVVTAQPPDYAVVGFDGYGVNSWAVHYVLVHESLALFVQFAWGGAFVDHDAARRAVTDAFSFAESLQGALQRAAALGKLRPGRRLVVSLSDLGVSRWSWIGGTGATEPGWATGDVYGGVVQAVGALFDDPSP